MKIQTQSESRRIDDSVPRPLEIVVPVTTPELTRAGIRAAERLASGLNAVIRLLNIQLVPFPLQLARPPIPGEFLQRQMAAYFSSLPLKREIRLARDFEPALMSALRAGSVILICAKKRKWRTRNERLANELQHAGHFVILHFEG